MTSYFIVFKRIKFEVLHTKKDFLIDVLMTFKHLILYFGRLNEFRCISFDNNIVECP